MPKPILTIKNLTKTYGQNVIFQHLDLTVNEGDTIVIIGPSGTGKSTHTQLWKKLFGERAVFINDDKPLLKISAQGVTVYGTPWDGKHHRSTNTSCPLKAVCILTRNTENSIQRIDKKAASSASGQPVLYWKGPVSGVC